MKLVVDASVAIKWVVAEEGRAEALRQTAGEELVAPEFVLVEAANILWKKVRRRELDAEQAQRGLSFITGAYGQLVPTGALIDSAFSLALAFDHPVYDCLYLACAEQQGVDLLTADAKFANKVGGRAVFLGRSA